MMKTGVKITGLVTIAAVIAVGVMLVRNPRRSDAVDRRPTALALQWRCKVGGEISAAPAVAAGRVFVGTTAGQVCAIDLVQGKKIWTWPLRPSDNQPGFEASPLYVDGGVYIGDERGRFYAIDAQTGRRRWVYPTGDEIAGAANVFVGPDGDKRILISSHDAYLHCVEAATGRRLWRSQSGSFINARPAVTDDHAVYGGCDGVIWVVNLADGKPIRRIEVGEPIIGAVAVDAAVAYVGNYGGTVVAADLKSGKIRWSYEDSTSEYRSTPVVTEGLVIIGGRDKRVHAIDTATGKARWTFAAHQAVDSSPLVLGDRIVVGSDDGRLYLLAVADGRKLWSYEIGSAIRGGAAFGQGLVVVGADDGYVYAFRPDTGKGAGHEPQ